MLEALRRWWQVFPFTTWVFPSPFSPESPISTNTARGWLNTLKKQAGINKRGGLHLLRHTYATHMLENGANLYTIQKTMGHKSLASTMIYLQLANLEEESRDSPLEHLPGCRTLT